MQGLARAWLLLCTLAAPTQFSAAQRAAAADLKPGLPFTYLFDTGSTSAAPLTGRQLAERPGWTLLDEDDTTHRFRGDAVLLNDKLAVALRRRGRGAELYGQTSRGWRARAVLAPLPAAGNPAGEIGAVRVSENTRGSVAVEGRFATAAGRPLLAKFSLAAGQRLLEVRAGGDTGRLLLWAKSRFVVVPDFFADDMVFGPESSARPQLKLPAENMFINLLDGHDALLMAMWRPGRSAAEALLAHDGQQRYISGCQVQQAGDLTLWVALIEGPNLWHQRSLSAENTAAEIALDWRPAFAARWRADLLRPNGAAHSWNVAVEPPGTAPAAAAPGECRCRFEGDRTVIDLSKADQLAAAAAKASTLVIYPMDRTRATPLTAFCPTDMLRQALGVGPCQYILQVEGLASETNPTPDQVMAFVEKQFEKKRQRQQSEQIKDLLGQMVDQVRRTQQRIEQYGALAREVQQLCPTTGPSASAAVLPALRETAVEMEQALAACRGAAEPAKQAADLSDRLLRLIDQDGPLSDCQTLAAELRQLGARQDRALSKGRMAVRWLRCQAAEVPAEDPHRAAAEKILEITAGVLKNQGATR